MGVPNVKAYGVEDDQQEESPRPLPQMGTANAVASPTHDLVAMC